MFVKLFPAGHSRERRGTDGVCCRRCGEDSDEHPRGDLSRPSILGLGLFSACIVAVTAGDAPRSDWRHLRRSFWRRAGRIVENHDGGGDAEEGSHESKDESSVLFDLGRKRLERIQNLPILLLDGAAAPPSHAAENPWPTCGVL